MSDDLTELFDKAIIIGHRCRLSILNRTKWTLEYCFNYIQEHGGVVRIDISKTPLQRMLNNVSSY
jgi:hypothetical protein